MEVCIATVRGRDIMLGIRDNLVWLDGEIMPIKHLAVEELEKFRDEAAAIPLDMDPQARQARLNAKRAAFIVNLLGKTVGDDAISELTHILDHVHWDVQEYLNA